MNWRSCLCVSAAFVCLGFAGFSSAIPSVELAARPITGELSKPGYTVIALTTNGDARTVVAQEGSFALQPPAETVTLHLRAPDGTYAGPIVLAEDTNQVEQAETKVKRAKKKVANAQGKVKKARGKQAKRNATKQLEQAKKHLRKAKRLLREVRKQKGQRVIVGVRAGATLARINVRGGYGRVLKKLPKKSLDASFMARARNGVPLGAGNFGRVASAPPRKPIAGDLDLDAIPDPLDIDDDGDLRLDNIDRTNTGRRSQSLRTTIADQASSAEYWFFYQLLLTQGRVVNANASSLTVQAIDAALVQSGLLMFHIYPLGDSTELDCTGLPYCSPGGTGRWWKDGPPPGEDPEWGEPFPACCDSDGDGFGALTPSARSCPICFILAHRAKTDRIGTGDVLTRRVASGGAETVLPTTLPMVAATVPALVSYRDTAGNCAKVRGASGDCATEFSYPPQPGDRGLYGNPFLVDADPGGDVVLTFTYWRPQRTPIPGDGGSAQWVDVGGLTYHTAGAFDYGPGTGAPWCSASWYSTTDPNLTPGSDDPAGRFKAGFRDLASDKPSSAANTLTYSVNMTKCLAEYGLSWNPGEERTVFFVGRDEASGFAGSTIQFKRR